MPHDDAEKPIVSSFAQDEEMMEIIELFVHDLPQRIEAVEAARRDSEWSKLKIFAHQLKGAAPAYGYDSIGEAAGEVEELVGDGSDRAGLSDAVDDLLSLCRRAAKKNGLS